MGTVAFKQDVEANNTYLWARFGLWGGRARPLFQSSKKCIILHLYLKTGFLLNVCTNKNVNAQSKKMLSLIQLCTLSITTLCFRTPDFSLPLFPKIYGHLVILWLNFFLPAFLDTSLTSSQYSLPLMQKGFFPTIPETYLQRPALLALLTS